MFLEYPKGTGKSRRLPLCLMVCKDADGKRAMPAKGIQKAMRRKPYCRQGKKSLRNGIIQRLHTGNLRIAGQRLIEIKQDVGNGRIRRDNGAFALSENHFVLTVKMSVL